MPSVLLLTHSSHPISLSWGHLLPRLLYKSLQMQMQALSQSHFLPLSPRNSFPLSSSVPGCNSRRIFSGSLAFPHSDINSFLISHGIKSSSPRMTSNCVLPNQTQIADLGVEDSDLDKFAAVSNKIADAAGEVIRKYFRKSFDILDKEDLSECFVYFACGF